MKEDKIALQDLLWVNECKSCVLPDERQQPENYQETEGTLRKPWMQSACGCRRHRGGVRVKHPAFQGKIPYTSWEMTAACKEPLLSFLPKMDCLNWISTVLKRAPQRVDGWARMATCCREFPRWSHLGGHSLPSPEWKCLQKEIAVGDVISPVGFHVTAVNSFNDP